jgi:hypothetical protein
MVNYSIPYEERMLHIRFQGVSRSIPLTSLDVGSLSNDRDVRQAVARYLSVPTRKLNSYVVERHANGNMTIRPEAVFG